MNKVDPLFHAGGVVAMAQSKSCSDIETLSVRRILCVIVFALGAVLPTIYTTRFAIGQDRYRPSGVGGAVPNGHTNACLAKNIRFQNGVSSAIPSGSGYELEAHFKIIFDCGTAQTSACAVAVKVEAIETNQSQGTATHCPQGTAFCNTSNNEYGLIADYPFTGVMAPGSTVTIKFPVAEYDPIYDCDSQSYQEIDSADYTVPN